MLQKNTRHDNPIKYPRNWLVRSFLRFIGRILLSTLFRIEIIGIENFPKQGPLILIGNHNAAMEAVLMGIYAPRQVEMLAAADLPQEKITEFFEAIYGYIPIMRGHVDRVALQNALRVLRQNGVLGIFPEGGIWEPGQMRAQSGVAWLSYRGKTPILPMAFAGTHGAMEAAFKLKRPRLRIMIGELIPPAKVPGGVSRKTYFETYAEEAMAQVRQMLPPDDHSVRTTFLDEHFDLEIVALDSNREVKIPDEYQIHHIQSLAKFLHRPMILKIFDVNFQLPIRAIQQLHLEPSAREIISAIDLILASLASDRYQYLLKYRFGAKQGEEMQLGLVELRALATWVDQQNIQIKVTPIRRYYSVDDDKEITQTEQEVAGSWM